MDIYELPNGKVVTTGSFSVAEWEEYLASLPKSKREALAETGPANLPAPAPGEGAPDDDSSTEPAPARRSRSTSKSTSKSKGSS